MKVNVSSLIYIREEMQKYEKDVRKEAWLIISLQYTN